MSDFSLKKSDIFRTFQPPPTPKNPIPSPKTQIFRMSDFPPINRTSTHFRTSPLAPKSVRICPILSNSVDLPPYCRLPAAISRYLHADSTIPLDALLHQDQGRLLRFAQLHRDRRCSHRAR